MLNPHVKAMFLDVSGPNKDAKSGGADEPKRPGWSFEDGGDFTSRLRFDEGKKGPNIDFMVILW